MVFDTGIAKQGSRRRRRLKLQRKGVNTDPRPVHVTDLPLKAAIRWTQRRPTTNPEEKPTHG